VRSQAARQIRNLSADTVVSYDDLLALYLSADTVVSYDDLLALYLSARAQLAGRGAGAVFARLDARQPKWRLGATGRCAIGSTRWPRQACAAKTRETMFWAWLKDRKIESLSPLEDVAWLVEKAYIAGPDEAARPSFP